MKRVRGTLEFARARDSATASEFWKPSQPPYRHAYTRFSGLGCWRIVSLDPADLMSQLGKESRREPGSVGLLATPGLQLGHKRVHLAFVFFQRHAAADIKFGEARFDFSASRSVRLEAITHSRSGKVLRRLALAGRELGQPVGIGLGQLHGNH
jgi:hypothetical protein